MRLPTRPTTRRSRSRFLRGPGLIRIRLWLAMLGLAVLPMVGVILIINLLAPQASPAGDRRAWDTAAAAAALSEAERALESRLLGVATGPEVQRLVDGVDGSAERSIVSSLVTAIEGPTRGLLKSACITRLLDGSQVDLVATAGAPPGTSACGSATLVGSAIEARPGAIVRGTTWGPDRTRRMVLATDLPATSRRIAGVLAVEIGLAELFAATPAAAEIGSSAVLVDMSTNTIAAGARTDAVVSGTGIPGAKPLGNLRVRLDGIISGHDGTARALALAGWMATAAPVWRSDDGAHFGLIHLWPVSPDAPSYALVGALVAFALIVLIVAAVTARTFLQPFDDLAESQAQLEVLYREAREDSLHDGLTGLGNHRSFQEELDRQLGLYRRHDVPVALLLIDLDDLKVVNDGEGHPAGDRLLVGMANAIRDTLRYGDRAFRIGGDEFAVILPHTDGDNALVAANRLRHFCLRPAAGERVIPFSGGISSVPQLAADRNELFRQADAALYRCKRNGRGTVAIFDADRDLVPQDASGQGAATAVRDIVRARNLTPVYQPIVDLRDGSVLGFEGLIRPGASSPFANPGELFAAAAAAGRTVELDLACFEVVAAGSVAISPEQVLTINLSPQTLETQDFTAGWLLEILARYQVSPGRVIVELTEREAITDLDRLRRNVAALQHAGVRLAADDVGAGNAGLRLLSQVRFDIMKIDLSLVQDGAQHDSSRAVLRSLMDLASRQGAVTIAEGLETAEQLRSLRELGITTGQGYLLGRPGHNLGLGRVDIEALAAGMLIVQSLPGESVRLPSPEGGDALAGTPA
jgi:diguanylate cyclase (GGDEF)-like protein